MGLFTSKTKITDPLAGQKTEAANWLLDMLKRKVDVPERQTADLTDLQKMVQSGLQGNYADVNENYDTARGHFTDVVNNQYDPRSSDFYKGLRTEAQDLKTESNTDIRQSANLGGMLVSTPRMAVEAENNRKIDNSTMTQLGGLYENERNRKDYAASNLGTLDSNRIANSGNLQAIAELERQVETERYNAIYEQALMDVVFPYQYQAGLASAIFSGSQPIVTGGGMTGLGMGLNMGAGALSSYIGAGGTFGGGGDKAGGGGGGKAGGIASGAMAGAQVGGPWGAVAGGVLGAFS